MSGSMGGVSAPPLAQRLLQVLPQTQCTRCGYPDCAAYAQAMAHDGVAINQCPPGGQEGIRRLAHTIGQPELATLPLNPDHGAEGPRAVAYIDENWCIGCTLCIAACPTDAIVGSNKTMHTVIEPYCTGCELCLPVCPVDCIVMENASGTQTGWAAWSQPQADEARDRYAFRSARLNNESNTRHEKQLEELETLAKSPQALAEHSRIQDPAELDKKRAVVQAALARARAAKPLP